MKFSVESPGARRRLRIRRAPKKFVKMTSGWRRRSPSSWPSGPSYSATMSAAPGPLRTSAFGLYSLDSLLG